MKKKSLYVIIALFGMLSFNSCIDDDYAVPVIEEPTFEGEANISIKNLKGIYTAQFPNTGDKLTEDQFVTISEDLIIEGYVVSNDQYGNFYKNLVIQPTTNGVGEGILIQLGENSLFTKYAVGQKLFVKCKGLVLGKYGNEVQIGAGKYYYKKKEWRLSPIAGPSINSHVFKDKAPVAITPTVKKIAELTADNRFTLVTIDNVQFKVATDQTWANVDGAHSEVFPFKETIIVDAEGKELVVFTSDYSKFAYQFTPKGSGSITGVLSAHKGKNQFIVSSLEDVKMDQPRFGAGTPSNPGGANTTPVVSIDFKFDNQLDKTDLNIEGWYNYIEKGTRRWQGKYFNTDKYGQATSYGSSDVETVTWLITQAVDLSTAKVLSLSTAKSYWNHPTNESPFEVLISTDFDGTNVAGATWAKLTGNFASNSSSDNAWVESGNINLPIATKGFIAFKYSGSNVKTTTYRIDNIKVTE